MLNVEFKDSKIQEESWQYAVGSWQREFKDSRFKIQEIQEIQRFKDSRGLLSRLILNFEF